MTMAGGKNGEKGRSFFFLFKVGEIIGFCMLMEVSQYRAKN